MFNGSKLWEEIVPGTDRMRIPGGWLYRTRLRHTHVPGQYAMVFVPNMRLEELQKDYIIE